MQKLCCMTLILLLSYSGISTQEDCSCEELESIKKQLVSVQQELEQLKRIDFATDALNYEEVLPIHHTASTKQFLVLGILSAPGNFERRDSIRKTWVNLIPDSTVTYKFLIGSSFHDPSDWKQRIKNEEKSYGDIIWLNVEEEYTKLIEKTLTVFQWAKDTFQLTYFMKLDDDSFLRPELLLQELHKREATQRLYLGFMHT